MTKYLHQFETEDEFKQAYDGSDYIEPWVSLHPETEKYATWYVERQGEIAVSEPFFYAGEADIYTDWTHTDVEGHYYFWASTQTYDDTLIRFATKSKNPEHGDIIYNFEPQGRPSSDEPFYSPHPYGGGGEFVYDSWEATSANTVTYNKGNLTGNWITIKVDPSYNVGARISSWSRDFSPRTNGARYIFNTPNGQQILTVGENGFTGDFDIRENSSIVFGPGEEYLSYSVIKFFTIFYMYVVQD